MSGTNYVIPSMKEIEQIPWNGYNVVSTFSGGGGSCLGYRMAGFRVLYANEFVEEAQKTYKANHKKSYLDCRDIRTVTPEQILEIVGLDVGDIDLFDGSPPCSAFSTAGSRQKGWGKRKKYSDGKVQTIEDLFEEYIRLLNGLQPKTFVAENVSGMIKGKAIGYFKHYIKEMKDSGYNVSAKLLNAKWLGVPQSRERVIFIGVRNDLCKKYGIVPTHPKPHKNIITLGEALIDVKNDETERKRLLKEYEDIKTGEILRMLPTNPPKPISAADVMNGSWFNLKRESMYTPCSTITQTGGAGAGSCHPLENRRFTIEELRRITSIPDDFILTGTYRQQWERLGRMVPPIMMKNIAQTIKEEVLDKIGN